MDDRAVGHPGGWPVPLTTVLEALRTEDEVTVDLATGGRLLIRWQAPDHRPAAGEDRSAPGTLPTGPLDLDEPVLQVLRLIDEGLPAAVVADALGLDLTEVARRLNAARTAAGVDSTTAAVDAARAAGLLPPR